MEKKLNTNCLQENLKDIKSFKDVWEFPLSLRFTKVFSDKFQMAFDFVPKWIDEDAVKISKEDKQKIVDILNGDSKEKISGGNNLRYENGTIYMNDRKFIWIRGWGYLTGVGGLNLSSEQAKELQDEFGNFIVDTLNFK